MTRAAAAFLLPYLCSAGLSLWVASRSFRRRGVAGGPHFTAMVLLEAIWTLAYIGQMLASSLAGKLWWNNLQFFGAVFGPLTYLGFALSYARPAGLRRGFWKLLLPIALGLLLFIWTDGWHGLFRGPVRLAPGAPFAALVFPNTPAFGLFAIYAYSLLVLTTLVLLARLLSAPPLYRAQISIVLTAMLLPWVAAMVANLGIVPFTLHDLTPLAFGPSNLILAWALFRYHLFDLAPVAREHLIEHMADGLMVLDGELRIVDLNPAAERILACRRSEALGSGGHTWLPLQAEALAALAPDTPTTLEAVLPRADAIYELQMTRLGHPGDGRPIYLVVLRDISARKAIENRLQELARTDPLTGLLNRRRVFDLAEADLGRTLQTPATPLALALIDIDHFKQVNDRWGHQAGDTVLRTLAELWEAQLRPSDRLGRYGGEEFLLVLPRTDRAGGSEIAERLRRLTALARFAALPPTARVTISVGVAAWEPGERPVTLDSLLGEADAALYRAKAAGRDRVAR